MGEDSNTSATNGVKSDVSALEAKIIQQVEYYFGDYNLLRDKFLQEQIKLEDGWIPLETMIKFNRLKILSTDFEVITTALKKSSSQLMEITEDGQKIRRTPLKPLPESDVDRKEDLISRTVYVKRFPDNTTLDELLEFFKDKGNISNICMLKKFNRKDFKGAVYLTFASKEDAEDFMKVKSIKYSVLELHRERKQDYIKRKQEQFEKRKELKEKRKKEKEISTNETEMKGEKDILKGCLLKLTGLGENTMWEDIKAVLSPYEEIAYVDYAKGKPQAVVRFVAEGAASIALSKASKTLEEDQNNESTENKLVIRGTEVAAMVIEGEEEEEYWNKVLACKDKKRMHKNHKKGKKQGKGRPQFKRNRRQKENDDSDEMEDESSSSKRQAQDEADDRPAKQIKVDADSD